MRAAKEAHDDVFLTAHVLPRIDDDMPLPKINDAPYLLGKGTMDFEQEMHATKSEFENMDLNLFYNNEKLDFHQVHRIIFHLRRRIQSLCRGEVRLLLINNLGVDFKLLRCLTLHSEH